MASTIFRLWILVMFLPCLTWCHPARIPQKFPNEELLIREIPPQENDTVMSLKTFFQRYRPQAVHDDQTNTAFINYPQKVETGRLRHIIFHKTRDKTSERAHHSTKGVVDRVQRHAVQSHGVGFLNSLLDEIRNSDINSEKIEEWQGELMKALQEGVVTQAQVHGFLERVKAILRTSSPSVSSPFWL